MAGRKVVRGLAILLVAAWSLGSVGLNAGQPNRVADSIVLENDHIRYVLRSDGRILGFVDKQTGKDYCAAPGRRAVMVLKKGSTSYQSSACGYADGKLTVQFEKGNITVVAKVTGKRDYLVLEVESVSNPQVDELDLSNLAVTSCKYVGEMSGVAADDQFAVCLRALNLQVRGQVGARPALLRATCYRQYGLVGAKIALVGCPASELRTILKDLVRQEGLPYSPLGGPWALDAEENRGSYLFATLSEKNVDQWIAMAHKARVACLHLIGWEQSLGHYQPRADLYPGGLEGLKSVVAKIHAAGLKAGMHTLTSCISGHDPWVTPVPDKRLGIDAAFTLAAALDHRETTVPTAEEPPQFDAVWAYSSRGNVIRIDDELISFGKTERRRPCGFTGCTRGAFGTKPAPHAKGSPVAHLNVRWGCFQPDENSTLVDDISDAIARVFNTCGFDMIYMDGITEDTMVGDWHAAAKMRRAIFQRLKQPVLVEASCWDYHSWPFHSRLGAWDHPVWGLKRFIDVHCRLAVLDVDGRTTERFPQSSLLPSQLGWWVISGPTNDYPAETLDEMEYLCAKALAYDAPVSFQGVDVGGNPWNARQDEYLALFARYERLRLGRCFPESIRKQLRAEKADFHLTQSPQGAWQLAPADYAKHKVTGQNDGSDQWTVTNRFAAQSLRLRIEALYSVEPYETAERPVLADFSRPEEFAARAAASGVTQALAASREQVRTGGLSGRFSAVNTRGSRRGAWSKVGKAFSPELDLARYDALGVWVYGDGNGELLNVQLTNPTQYWPVRDEHYITVDFHGWRYFELLLRERDAETCEDYVWPQEPNDHYAIYRSPLVRQHVNGLNLHFNELPARAGAMCYLSPIKALKAVKARLINPTLQIGGRRVVFPVTLESGSCLELTSASDCKHYDERGALVADVKFQADIPGLDSGENRLKLLCQGPQGLAARARITVISYGDPLSP